MITLIYFFIYFFLFIQMVMIFPDLSMLKTS